MREITRLLCRKLKIRKIIVPIPLPLVYIAAWILKHFTKKPPINRDIILGVTMDANFSYEDAKRDIGYTPITFMEGLKRELP